MKFYLATNPGKGFCDAAKVQEAMDYIRAGGHEITVDWLALRDEGGRQATALRDLRGVAECDGFILLDADTGKGMYTELGAALALNKQVAVVGAKTDMIFFSHPNVVRVATLAEALWMLNRDGN